MKILGAILLAIGLLVAGGLLERTGHFIRGKDGARGSFSFPAPDGAPGRDVDVRIERDDVVVRLDDALDVRVLGGHRAARVNMGSQGPAIHAAVFSYHEIAVSGDWAFVFGHAIRVVERGRKYEVDGKPLERESAGVDIMKIELRP